jgi:hypothetical protein
MEPGEVVVVEREPANVKTPNAVAVKTRRGDVIGYFPDPLAAFVSPCLNNGIATIKTPRAVKYTTIECTFSWEAALGSRDAVHARLEEIIRVCKQRNKLHTVSIKPVNE